LSVKRVVYINLPDILMSTIITAHVTRWNCRSGGY